MARKPKKSALTKKRYAAGLQIGRDILAVALKLHPNCIGIPLYRSCMIIEQGVGCCFLHCYNDPGWMGEELTKDNLKRYYEKVAILGDRAGAYFIAECRSRPYVLEIPIGTIADELYDYTKGKKDLRGGDLQELHFRKLKTWRRREQFLTL